jgi:hypothetical protein
MEKKQATKEELDISTKKVVKKKKKGEEETLNQEVIQENVALNGELQDEGLLKADNVVAGESFWEANGLLIGGGVLGVLGGAAIAGGGKSKSSTGATHPDVSTTTISVQDGKISGAMVFADGNNNGLLDFTDSDGDGLYDLGETLLNGDTYLGTTDSKGEITISSFLVSNKTIITQGGTDITTGLAVTVSYKGTAGSTVVSPITTLIQQLVQNGKTEVEAETLVKVVLGLDSSIDLNTYDPTKDTGVNSLAVQKAAIQIANILTVISSINGVDSNDVLSAIATNLTSNSNITDSTFLTTIIENSLTNAKVTTTLSSADIALSLANINNLIKDATTLESVVALQEIAQDNLSTAIENIDTTTIKDLKDNEIIINTANSKNDITAPILTLETLEDIVLSETDEKSSFTQNYTASDDVKLKLVTAVIKDSNGNVIENISLTTRDGKISGDLSLLSNGSYTIEVIALDYNGNSTVKTQTIIIGQGSYVFINEISNGYVNATEDNTSLTVSGTSISLANGTELKVTIGNKNYTTTVLNNSWSLEISSADVQNLTIGLNSVKVSTSDAATSTATFVYDTTAPTLVLGNYPIVSDSKLGNSFSYAYAASDVDSSVSKVTAVLKTTSGTIISGVNLTANNGTISGDISSLTKGTTYILYVTAIDTAGNSTISSKETILNLTEAASYSQNFSWTSGTKVVTTATIQDISGNVISGISVTAANQKLTGDLSSLNDGVYRIVVKLNYNNGEEILYREQLITIDKSAPTLTLETLDDTILSASEIATFTQSYSAVDSNGNGIASVLIKVKNSTGDIVKEVTKTQAYGNLSGLLDDLSSGTYTIEVSTTDIAGNISSTKSQIITLDTQADTIKPTVTISDNMDGIAKGEITYTITFSEAVSGFDINDLTVTNGTKGAFTQVNAYTYTLVVTPTSSTIGELTVSIPANIAQDSSGNTNEASIISTQSFDTLTENIAPTLILGSSAVSSDSKSAGSFAYSYAVSDESGIDTVTATLKSGTSVVNGVTLSVGNGIVTGNLSSLASGTYVIELTAIDINGNSTTKIQEFTYNTSSSGTAVVLEQLTSNIYNITDAAVYAQHVSCTSSSNVAVTAVVKDIDGNTVDSITLSYDATNKLISGDLSSLSNGIYHIEVTASYKSGSDIVVKDQIIIIDSSAASQIISTSDNLLFSSDIATTAGVSADSSAYFAEFADYDNDGDMDLLIGSNSSSAISKLYSNNGDGTFTDVTSTTIGNISMSLGGIAWVDYDKDGDLDIVMAGGSSSTATKILQNNNGVFSDVGVFVGVTTESSIKSVSVVDYDGDGDMDLYFTAQAGENKLYSNNGDGTFSDMTTIVGIAGNTVSQDQQSLWGDFDKDGDMDLFVAVNNASGSYANSKYYTNNGNGTFTDTTLASIGDISMTLVDAVVADYDGDGDLDIFLPGVVSGNKLLQNDGTGKFIDVALTAGVAGNSAAKIYGAEFTDLDGDGDLDLITTGVNSTTIYLNNGNGTFSDATTSSGITNAITGRDIAVADIDNDGDKDVVVISSSSPLISVYENLAIDMDKPTVIITDNVMSSYQISIIDIGTIALSNTLYSVTINDITISYMSDATATLSEVYSGLKSAIEGNTTLNTVVEVASSLTNTDQFILTSKIIEGFTLSASGGNVTSYLSSTGVATNNITYTFTFLEPVIDFTSDDVAVVNGVAGTLTKVSDRVYTLVITPIDEFVGEVSVSIAADKFTDVAGNNNLASEIITQAVNTKNADVVISTDAIGISISDVTYTFTFNENVTGFTIDDIVVQNGTKGTFTAVNGSIYTLVVTPDTQKTGNISVSIASNVAIDADSNGNLAASAALQAFNTDTANPILTITDNISDTQANGNIIFTFTFNEYVNGFTTGDITVTNASKGSFVTVETGRVYTLVVAPLSTGEVTITVAENMVTDLGGNANLAVTATQAYTDIGAINTANLGDKGYVITGSTESSGRLGYSVSDAGDVNGDGYADVIVSAYRETTGTTSGAVYVIFGKTDTTTVDVSNLGTNGYKIYDSVITSRLGTSVSDIGDLNGDGLSDLLISGNNTNGRAYVVYGKTDTTDIDLSTMTASQGFSITANGTSVLIGKSVSAGDIDGDGIDDIMVSNSSTTDGSSTYIIFGKSITGTTTNIELSTLVADGKGIVINGVSSTGFGNSIAYVGDVNGDGLGDMLISAYYTKNDIKTTQQDGSAYLIYGTTESQIINISNLTTIQGYEITGPIPTEEAVTNVRFGQYVGYAGDINGDGYADMLIGSSNSATYGYKAYVVFGQEGTSTIGVDVTTLEANNRGFVIQNGTNTVLGVGSAVSYAGDFNGDGLADVIVGASSGNQAFVVYGKTDSIAVNLDDIANGVGGFVINGGVSAASTGISVSYAGDVNGDGFDDLIIGASAAAITVTNADGTTSTTSNVGQSYVLFGGSSKMTMLDYSGTSADDIIIGTTASETAVLGAGNDIYTANGGADVIYAGAGDDIIILNADNIAKLEAGVTDGRLSKIDGGSGTDTIKLDGSGIIFDLTNIDNILGVDSRIESIEKIDLTGNGDNSLKLSLSDVLDINSAQLLTVEGNSGDSVNLLSADGWILSNSTVSANSNTYSVYTSGNAELRIDTDITSIIA